MAVDTLFNDVRLLLQSGSLTNAATSSPASVGSSGVTGGATLTFASDGIITASSVSLASPAALATLELVVTPTWDEYSKIASMLGLSLNAVSPGVIGIYSFATVTPTLVGSLNTAQSGEITLIAEYLVSGASTEIKLTAIPLSGTTTTTTVSAASAVGILPATLVLGGPPSIPVPAPGGSATVARIQAPRAQYSQQQIASLRNTNPSNSIIYSSTPVSVTAAATGASYTYTITNPAGRTVDDVLSELALGISQLNGAVLMAETGYYTGAEARASLRLTFTPISSDVDNWAYSFVGMPYATAIYFLEGVYGANPPLPQISTATYTFTPGTQNIVSLTVFGTTITGNTSNMPGFAVNVSDILVQNATVDAIYPFAGQCIIYVTGAIGVDFTMSAALGADVTVPSGIATLKAARVTAKRRYIDLGAAVEYPALPWPTTSIPAGGGGGGSSDTNTMLLTHLNEDSGTFIADSTGRTFTASADLASHTTASGKFSGALAPTSLGFKAVGSSSVPFPFATKELTIEFFLTRLSAGGNQFEMVFAQTDNPSSWDNGLVVIINNGTYPRLWMNGTHSDDAFPSLNLSVGQWKHLAFVRTANSNTKWYVDGVGTSGYNMPFDIVGGMLPYIGNTSSGAYGLQHFGIDELRISNIARYTANFTPPTAPFEIGGTGWGTLPSDVIFAVPAESNGNDVAQFGLSATASGTATIQASGSRTSDGYLRNTDSAQGADACFGYTPSAGFKSAWGSAQSMTLEFDLRADSGNYADCNIVGVGDRHSSIGAGILTGLRLDGSPFSTSAGHADLTPNTWHHIAFVADYNGGSRVIRLYRDGVQQGTPEPVGSFGFNDWPTPTTIGILQRHIGYTGLGALKGGMDNVILTTRAKYNADFTPGTTFAEIVGYTPPPSGVDVSIAGYNDLDTIIGDGTFNTQLTPPDAYFFSVATLDDFGGTGNAYTVDGNSINFTGSRTLENTTCTGTFVRGTPQNFDSTVTLDDTTAVSTFYCDVPVEWSGDSTIDDATTFGIHATLAPASFSGDSLADDVATSIVAASFTATAPITFRLNQAVPAASLVAEVAQYAGYILSSTVPSASCASWFGMRLAKTLPAVGLQSAATFANTLRLNAGMPRVEIDANILNGRSFSLHSDVPTVSLSAWTGWQLIASVPVASITGDIVVGGAYRLSAVVPKSSVSSSAVAENVLRLDSVVPSVIRAGWAAMSRTIPAARMIGHIAPVVATTRLAYSFTLANSAMTRYPAYPFIQVFRMGNAYYGVGEDGLYEIGGTTDNGADIPWSWETCMSDFGQAEKKTVVSAYLGGYVPKSMTYTIKAGDVPTGTNVHATTATAVLRNHRQKLGIGRKSRFFAFGLSSTQGRVAIESIEFEMANLSRRV